MWVVLRKLRAIEQENGGEISGNKSLALDTNLSYMPATSLLISFR